MKINRRIQAHRSWISFILLLFALTLTLVICCGIALADQEIPWGWGNDLSRIKNESWSQENSTTVFKTDDSEEKTFSTIFWDAIDEGFSDFDKWKAERISQSLEINGFQGTGQDGESLRKKIGYVLACWGKCYLERETDHRIYVGPRSILREGDELQTEGQSLSWVYFFDGSLLRLGHYTSVNFYQMGVSPTLLTLYFRLNKGHIVYINRDFSEVKNSSMPLTDVLPTFLTQKISDSTSPLGPGEVLTSTPSSAWSQLSDSFKYFEKMGEQLNQEIQKNNRALKFIPTLTLLAAPNITLKGKNTILEMYHLNDGKTLFKLRPRSFYYQEKATDPILSNWEALLRGFQTPKLLSIKENQWFAVNQKGKEMTELSELQAPLSGELITKRITSALRAREAFFHRYSRGLFIPQAEKMAKGSLSKLLEERIDYHLYYTRPFESMNLFYAQKILMRNGIQEIPLDRSLDFYYHQKSLNAYYQSILRGPYLIPLSSQ